MDSDTEDRAITMGGLRKWRHCACMVCCKVINLKANRCLFFCFFWVGLGWVGLGGVKKLKYFSRDVMYVQA